MTPPPWLVRARPTTARPHRRSVRRRPERIERPLARRCARRVGERPAGVRVRRPRPPNRSGRRSCAHRSTPACACTRGCGRSHARWLAAAPGPAATSVAVSHHPPWLVTSNVASNRRQISSTWARVSPSEGSPKMRHVTRIDAASGIAFIGAELSIRWNVIVFRPAIGCSTRVNGASSRASARRATFSTALSASSGSEPCIEVPVTRAHPSTKPVSTVATSSSVPSEATTNRGRSSSASVRDPLPPTSSSTTNPSATDELARSTPASRARSAPSMIATAQPLSSCAPRPVTMVPSTEARSSHAHAGSIVSVWAVSSRSGASVAPSQRTTTFGPAPAIGCDVAGKPSSSHRVCRYAMSACSPSEIERISIWRTNSSIAHRTASSPSIDPPEASTVRRVLRGRACSERSTVCKTGRGRNP